MIDRYQRCTLASGTHVRGAQIIDHIDAGRRRQPGAVTNLASAALLRPVPQGLAVKADHIDIPGRERSRAEQCRHSLTMGVSEGGFGTLVERAEPRSERRLIGACKGRAAFDNSIAVADQ